MHSISSLDLRGKEFRTPRHLVMSRQLAGDSNTCDWGRNRSPHNTSETQASRGRPVVETRGPCADNISPEHSPSGPEQHTSRLAHSLRKQQPHISAPLHPLLSGQLEMASIPRKTTVKHPWAKPSPSSPATAVQKQVTGPKTAREEAIARLKHNWHLKPNLLLILFGPYHYSSLPWTWRIDPLIR